MSSIRLIVSDIDGTILDQQHQVDPDLIELMPQLLENKIPFILASAHSPIGIAPIARRLGIHQENRSLATMELSSSREKRFYLNTA